jgi:molecular chaperone DnaK (HSP70)
MCSVSLKKDGYLPDVYSSEDSFSDRTFIGIDFGTSTTVVSFVYKNNKAGPIIDTFQIEQPKEFGGTVSHELVNSVLAWKNDNLIFGREAYQIRQDLFEGINVFSSFKMRLGVDIGPTYPETKLKRSNNLPYVIESAQNAASVFFDLLRQSINKAVRDNKLPEKLFFSVSVPASFQTNQRRDLLNVIRAAGYPVTESCFIDEPNAAFLSYYYYRKRENFLNIFDEINQAGDKKFNILVYDFGAGTCDISILEISIEDKFIKSRNRAISQFTAFGGDNFDMAIANEVLLDQLLASNPSYQPLSYHKADKLIPRLMPAAERLKIAAMEWISDRGFDTIEDLEKNGSVMFETNGVDKFSIVGNQLSLKNPSITLQQLANVFKKFLKNESLTGVILQNNVISPVLDALEKAEMQKKDLDAVLFIGGSAANPLVRKAVMDYLPGVKAIVPPDLQRHVSLGSAIHSFFYNGLNVDIIKPITPETIFVIVENGRDTIIPVSSPVPTENDFTTILEVPKDHQKIVELPICAGTERKLLGVLQVKAPTPLGFNSKDEIFISASINHEKLLKIEARIENVKVSADLLNPLANTPLTDSERKLLLAKQKLNEALLKYGSNPPVDVVIDYAQSAQNALEYEIAADMYCSAERIDPEYDFSTDICYCYSIAGKSKLSDKWAKIAYERNPCSVTAYNLSIRENGETKIYLLRQSLKYNDEYTLSLYVLGKLLFNDRKNSEEGRELLNKFVKIIKRDCTSLFFHNEGDIIRLKEISLLLNDPKLAEWAKEKLVEITNRSNGNGYSGIFGPYEKGNLPKSKTSFAVTTTK